MTAIDPLARARVWVDALNSGDPDAVIAVSHEDVVLVPRLVGVEGGSYTGHEGVRRWLGERAEVWREMTGELTDVRAIGDGVAGTGVLRGTSRATGLTVDEPIAGVIRFRGERAYWIGFFRTEAEALAESGLGGTT
jgi:ketosteroid isomerase-like protein